MFAQHTSCLIIYKSHVFVKAAAYLLLEHLAGETLSKNAQLTLSLHSTLSRVLTLKHV